MTDTDNPLNLTNELLGEVVAYSHQAAGIETVNDPDTAETARLLRGKLKAVEQRIEQARVAAKAPYLQSAKQIDGLANVIFAQVRPHIERLDKLRVGYAQRFGAPQMPVVPQPETGVTSSPFDFLAPDLSQLATGVGATPPQIRTRVTKDIQILDESRVPDEFWVIDEVKLRQAVLRENRDVPGVIIVEKTSVLE